MVKFRFLPIHEKYQINANLISKVVFPKGDGMTWGVSVISNTYCTFSNINKEKSSISTNKGKFLALKGKQMEATYKYFLEYDDNKNYICVKYNIT